ncbi:MAG TPA: NepR family anti-sigma factor [Hyphomicrobiaceae bacterium]|nr:NepR family anti-sigma factor [Hyphomicrobiaceae bacterium]
MLKPRSRPPSATRVPARRTADPVLSAAIGRELKARFDGIAAEPVPDRFRQLLEELERQSHKG